MIDILLSTYNGEKYLEQQLQSIIEQSCADWHLIVRDDGSTDQTLCILDKFAKQDPRISVFTDEKGNIGALRSYEELLKKSESDYVMFCDQDDVWLPEKISHTAEGMQDAESKFGVKTPLLVYSDLQVTDEKLTTVDTSFWHYAGIHPQNIVDFPTLAGKNCVTGCTTMINKTAKAVSLPFGEHALMHDHAIALSVIAHDGKLIENPHADILYRQHGSNVIGAWKDMQGKKLFLHRLTHISDIWQQNIDYIRQARDIQQIGFCEYCIAKSKYKKSCNG